MLWSEARTNRCSTPEAVLSCPVSRQVAYSAVFSLAISGGRGRSALVWQPAARRLLAELTGHAASITHLAFDEQASQVASRSRVLNCCLANRCMSARLRAHSTTARDYLSLPGPDTQRHASCDMLRQIFRIKCGSAIGRAPHPEPSTVSRVCLKPSVLAVDISGRL
jgi:hypothetical protein